MNITPVNWWAIAVEAVFIAVLVCAAYWYRLHQSLEVQRIRTRLASDLHDEIGSGLAEIALLTEVAMAEPASAGHVAARVGARARQLREGMSDIVWSVDPHQGSLADLTNRVRQAACSMLEAGGSRVEFDVRVAPAAVPAVRPDRARQVLLICREALTNIARHACATAVSVHIEWKSNALLVDVRDNGRGFDPDFSYPGMGLRNLQRRAQEAGGKLAIDSSPGHGTSVRAWLPLR
jgi:signal transduction histidine kinase